MVGCSLQLSEYTRYKYFTTDCYFMSVVVHWNRRKEAQINKRRAYLL